MKGVDMYDDISNLVGAKIQRIFMDEDRLTFLTDKGNFSYYVEGDCCSRSYFFDFHGVDKLLANGPVVSTRSLDLDTPDDEDARKGECVQAYGFEIVTEHPSWGEQTSVFSFRNDSNGYYGGSLTRAYEPIPLDFWKAENELFADCLEVRAA